MKTSGFTRSSCTLGVLLGWCFGLSACSDVVGEADVASEPGVVPGDPTLDPGDPSLAAGDGCDSQATRRLRRLAGREYLNVITDLLGPQAAAVAAPMLPFEPRRAGFDNQAEGLLVSAAFQEALVKVAERITASIDPLAIAPCETADTTVCLEGFARSIARRAYGRPATSDELTRILTAAATGTDYAESVRLVLQVVLQSPNTLYATELGPVDAEPNDASVRLTEYEVASQLSFLLIGSRPDEALLVAAEAGSLNDPAGIQSEVQRLLQTPRAQLQLRLFINGWMNLGAIAEAPKNATAFPELDADVVAAMQSEVDSFIDEHVAFGQGTLAGLLSGTSNQVPPALQFIYQRDPNTETRRGLLSLPGVLTYHSADQHSGPIERGLLVRRQLFCQEVPAPPPAVLDQIMSDPVDVSDTERTTRQKYEMHLTESFCAACHSQFDPIGFGLEEMDGMGRFRTTENGLPVDSTGELTGTDVDAAFEGVAQLSSMLAESEMLEACFVEHFFRFAEARAAEASEGYVVDRWTQGFRQGGGRLIDLIGAYVHDPTFLCRREDR